jgi:hypothetical protein
VAGWLNKGNQGCHHGLRCCTEPYCGCSAGSSVLEGGCSQYEEVRAHNILEKSCIDLCPSGSCSKNPVFHSPTTHLFSFLEGNLGLSVLPSPTFISFLFSSWVCQI